MKRNTYTGEIKAPKKICSLNKPKLEHIHSRNWQRKIKNHNLYTRRNLDTQIQSDGRNPEPNNTCLKH